MDERDEANIEKVIGQIKTAIMLAAGLCCILVGVIAMRIQPAPPAPIVQAAAPVGSCPLIPCRDEAMSVIDSDGQRIECSSERHVLRFANVGDRVFAFCRCAVGGGGTPAGVAETEEPGLPPIPIRHADPSPRRKP